MGCPKEYPDLDLRVEGKSHQAVRCCSPDGETCTFTPCETQLKMFAEAESICFQKGMRLCTPNELNKCCGSECDMDYFLTWVENETIEGT